MGFRLTGIVIAVALFLPAGALAQSKAPSTATPSKEKAEAKLHYDQGTVHFNLDEWPQAIEEFKAAYRLYPDAIFLYNIAQCHRKLAMQPRRSASTRSSCASGPMRRTDPRWKSVLRSLMMREPRKPSLARPRRPG